MSDNSENGSGFAADTPETGEKVIEGWHVAKPEVLPSPSYWPLALAFGAALLGFGVLTSYIISVVGLVVFVIAITKWIGELCRERG
jgi:hypothetical protein